MRPMAKDRIRVGKVEILSLVDTTIEFPLEQVFPDPPPHDWAPFEKRYPKAFGRDTWVIPVRCFALRSAGRTILVDTGLGTNDEISSRFGGTGRLREALRAASLEPEDVDTVILTHLHLDHVGGTMREEDGEARLAFPRARYLLHRADLERARALAAGAPLFDATILVLERLGALDPLDGERAVSDEVSVLHTPGHTPGSLSVLVASGGRRALLTADALHHPAHVTETGLRDSSDADPEAARRTRERLLERVQNEGMTLAPTHFPEPFGRIVWLEGRRYWKGL